MKIAGIDEAGKGPVLGPMCIAGVMFEEPRLDLLERIGVRDSKKIAPKKRESLAREIRKIADKIFILEVSAREIDDLRRTMTLNEVMVLCHARVLEELRPDRAFVDAADVDAERFGRNIKERYSGTIEIVSEHGADEKYPIVSAASILAKVRRDEAIRELEKKTGIPLGSGYPGDPRTKKFLEQWMMKHEELPDFVRHSWETARQIQKKKGQRPLSGFSQ